MLKTLCSRILTNLTCNDLIYSNSLKLNWAFMITQVYHIFYASSCASLFWGHSTSSTSTYTHIDSNRDSWKRTFCIYFSVWLFSHNMIISSSFHFLSNGLYLLFMDEKSSLFIDTRFYLSILLLTNI